MHASFLMRRIRPSTKRGLLTTTADCLLCSRPFGIVRDQEVATFEIDDEAVAYVCPRCARRKSQTTPRPTAAGGNDEVTA